MLIVTLAIAAAAVLVRSAAQPVDCLLVAEGLCAGRTPGDTCEPPWLYPELLQRSNDSASVESDERTHCDSGSFVCRSLAGSRPGTSACRTARRATCPPVTAADVRSLRAPVYDAALALWAGGMTADEADAARACIVGAPATTQTAVREARSRRSPSSSTSTTSRRRVTRDDDTTTEEDAMGASASSSLLSIEYIADALGPAPDWRLWMMLFGLPFLAFSSLWAAVFCAFCVRCDG